MTMAGIFNAHAGQGFVSELSELAHRAIDIEPVNVNQQFIDDQDKMRQQAAAAGDVDVLGGRMASGVASTSAHALSEQERKKRKERVDLAMLLQERVSQMEEQLGKRIEFMNDVADKLREKSDKLAEDADRKFDLAERMCDTHDVCEADLQEDGKLEASNREKLAKQIKEADRELGRPETNTEAMTPRDLMDKQGQHRCEVRQVATQKSEQSDECRKSASTIKEKAVQMAKEFKEIRSDDTLSLDEKAQKYEEVMERAKNDRVVEIGVALADDPHISHKAEEFYDVKYQTAVAKDSELGNQTISSELNMNNLGTLGL